MRRDFVDVEILKVGEWLRRPFRGEGSIIAGIPRESCPELAGPRI